MNIHTVAANLRNTIAGKEQHLLHLQQALDGLELTTGSRIALDSTAKFLVVNIDELKRILQDVEVCCEQYTEMGWQINPERMGQ